MSSTIDPGNAECSTGASRDLFEEWSANLSALGVTLSPELEGKLKAICFATATALAQAIESAGGLDQGPTGGAGITEGEHESLPTLVHSLSSSLSKELEYDVDGNLIRVTSWTNGDHTEKIRETILDYAGESLTSVTTTQYEGGVASETLTKTFSYDVSGNVTGVEYIRS